MTYGIESSEILRYSPPKSTAFGQISCPVNPQFAINKMSSFLSEFTHFQVMPSYRPELSIHCRSLPINSATQEWAGRRMSAAHRFFSPGGCTEHSGIWYVDEKEVQSAVRFIFDDPPPDATKSRALLKIYYVFIWRGFWGRPPPNQQQFADFRRTGEASSLGLILDVRRLFIQPNLVFPVSYDSAIIQTFIQTIEAALPIRLRDHYFKHRLRKSNGTLGQLRKLDKHWRTVI